MKIESIISELKLELDSLITECKKTINLLRDQLHELSKVSSKFDDNWIGSWASSSYNLYNNFIDGEGSMHVDEERISKYLEEITGITLMEIRDNIPKITKPHRDFQAKLVTELSIIKGQEKYSPEIELLDQIEKHKWGMRPWEYVEMRTPKQVFTYDPSIINKGVETPPHLNIGGEIISLTSALAATEQFQKNASRILRQLELKNNINVTPENKSDFIIKVINSFHNVALQLRHRYNKRNTLIIEDEYDVQDLLHSLLRIEFDDIRQEEYTPSYAGSSTRMDFLLKNEKIVIEVKKTREKLADKEVGDQLILDTQHYKAHPYCARLICFIYDPDDRIKNPRGLEQDLNSLSEDGFLVEVFIR